MDAEIKDEFNAVRAQLRNTDGRLQTIEARVQTLDGRVQALDGRVQTLDGRVQALDQHVQSLDERVETLDERVQTEGITTRRHFDVIAESLRDDIRIIAEGLIALDAKFEATRNSG
jgi:chromosome segregation ATPase